MPHWSYTRGLHDLGAGNWAWLQPDGGWGWSNAGLIESDGDCVLVDTLYDLKLTRTMLDAMRDAVPAAARIDTLVNTHSNADHTFGNELVAGARIISSTRCAEEMRVLSPQERYDAVVRWRELGDAGFFQHDTVGKAGFDFSNITVTLPTETFDGALDLRVGGKQLRLIEVGPAHTGGDTLIHVPEDRIVYTGDILFVGGTPPAWTGPIGNWLRACDIIESLDVDVVIPGHGPIADLAAVRQCRSYFQDLAAQVRARFEAGLTVAQAADDIDMRAYDGWLDAERIIVNVNTLYREYGATGLLGMPELRAWMGRYRREKHRAICTDTQCTHEH